MNTTKIAHRIGRVTAILIGSAVVLGPITANASEAGAMPAAELIVHFATGERDLRQQIPTGPDIALSARVSLRRALEAYRGDSESTGTAAATLRQLIEADRPATAVQLQQLCETGR